MSTSCDYVVLHDESDYVDVIKDLEMGSHPGLSRWAPGHHKGPYKQEDQNQREDVRMEAEIREERTCYAVGFQDGQKGHQIRNASDI